VTTTHGRPGDAGSKEGVSGEFPGKKGKTATAKEPKTGWKGFARKGEGSGMKLEKGALPRKRKAAKGKASLNKRGRDPPGGEGKRKKRYFTRDLKDVIVKNS